MNAFQKRMFIHRHNGLRGSARRACLFIEDVMFQAAGTTPHAKQLAADIRPILAELYDELKKRVDP